MMPRESLLGEVVTGAARRGKSETTTAMWAVGGKGSLEQTIQSKENLEPKGKEFPERILLLSQLKEFRPRRANQPLV